MNEAVHHSGRQSWLERQVRHTSFTEAIAQHVLPLGEPLPSQEVLQARVAELYDQSDMAIYDASDLIRQYIHTATDWQFGVRQKVDGRYTAYARTTFLSTQGDGYVIEVKYRGAENIPGLVAHTPVEEDGFGGWVQEGEYSEGTAERVALLLQNTSNAVVYFTAADVIGRRRQKADVSTSELDLVMGTYHRKPEVIDESFQTKPKRADAFRDDQHQQGIGYTNVYIGDNLQEGLAGVSSEDASRVLRGLVGDRATIIAEEQTGWQEYHEISDRLALDSTLTDDERARLHARGVDINAMNGLLDYEVGGWKDRFIYDRYRHIERSLLEEGFVWDEYAGQAVRQALLEPASHVFMEDRVRIQKGAAAALKALRLTSPEVSTTA